MPQGGVLPDFYQVTKKPERLEEAPGFFARRKEIGVFTRPLAIAICVPILLFLVELRKIGLLVELPWPIGGTLV